MAEIGSAFLKVQPDLTGLNARMVGYFNSSDWGKLGKTAGLALGAGIAAGGAAKALYEIGQAFDDVNDKLRTQTGATGKELAKLEGSFKKVIGSTPTDFDTASSAVAGLNQRLGLTGKPLTRLSKQLVQLSKITNTDVSDNVQSVTRLFGDWSVKTKDQADRLDELYRASENTGIKVGELSDLMVQFGSPLRQLGFDFDHAAAMFSAFEQQGVNMQTLLPGLRYALKNFSAPTADLAKTFKQLGVNVKDPEQSLETIFQTLKDSKSDVEANGLAFQIFGARAGPDMAAAVREGRFDLDKLLQTMEDGTDTISKSERATRDFGEEWTLLKNNVFIALEPIAKKVFGNLGDEMKRVTNILTDKHLSTDEKFTAIMDEIQRAATKWGPKIATAGGKLGIALVKGIASAFWHSDILGKLFIGGAALRLFGGSGVFGKLGATIGSKISGPLLTQMTGAFGGSQATGAFSKMGRLAGKLVGPAMGLSLVAVLASDPAVQKAIKNLFGEPLSSSDREAFAVKLEDWFDADSLKTQFEGKNRVAIQTALGEMVFNAKTEKLVSAKSKQLKDALGKGYSDAFQVFSRIDSQPVPAKYFEGVRDEFDKTGKKAGNYSDKVDKETGNASAAAQDHAQNVGRAVDKVIGSLDKGEKKAGDYADGTGKDFGRVDDKSGSMAKGVGRNIVSLANAVGAGLQNIHDNTNEALKGFGVKQVEFSIKKASDSVGSLLGAQKGAIVPGSGTGDKVPLHIAGQLAAMVEPGEQVSVLNRKATAAMMEMNSKIPRFAGGGVIEQALGPYTIPPIQYDPNHAGGNSHVHLDFFTAAQALAYGHKLQGMGWSISEYTPKQGNPWNFGPITTQHQSPGHYDGTAFDANTAEDETRSQVAAVARLVGGAGGVAAVAEKVARVLLKGPDGPLKSLGQSALDKVRGAANRFIASKMPSDTGVGGPMIPGAPIKSLPQSLQKFNKQWPYDSANSIGAGPTQALARWQHLPTWFYKIAIGESNFEPGAVGHDPGGTTGYGLYQETDPFANAYVKAVTGGLDYNKMLNPVLNTMAAKLHFDAAPSQVPNTIGFPWYGTSGLQRGGIVQKLAAGGISGDVTGSGIQGRPTLDKLMKKIRDYTKRITSIRDRIGRAETLAGLVQSPFGSDLSPDELDKQLSLNRNLLGGLKGQRNLVKDALVLSGGKVGRIGSRLDDLGGDKIARLHNQVKDLRSTLTKSGGDAQIEKLRDQLRNTKSEKGKAQLQRRISQLEDARDKRKGEVENQITKLQKEISDLRDKQQTRRERLGGKLSSAKQRQQALQEMLGTLQGPNGKTGDIFDAWVQIQNLKGTQIAGPGSGLDLGGLRDLLEARSFGTFAGGFAKGGTIPAGKWGITGEHGPEPVRGPATVYPNSTLGGDIYLTADIYIGDEKVGSIVDQRIDRRERRSQLADKAGAGRDLMPR